MDKPNKGSRAKSALRFSEYIAKRLAFPKGHIVNRSYQLRAQQIDWIEEMSVQFGVDKSEIVRSVIDFVMEEGAQ